MTIVLNGTTGISGVDGSASTPSLQGNDTNTGIFYPAADTIAFAEGGVESMRLDSNGNVGIGTTSPAFASGTGMQVKGSGDTNIRLSSGSTTGLDLIKISDGTSYLWNRDNASLLFGTNNAERMRIDTSGNVFVNTTSQIDQGLICAAYNGQAKQGIVLKDTNATLNGSYMYFINSAGSLAGQIQHNGTTTVSYVTSSDYRLKENIVPMTGALDKIAQLKPVTYTWKNTNGEQGEGFIAHELAEVCPLAVSGKKDDVNEDGSIKAQGIDTSFLVATLTAAIQEQQTIINDLKARVTALEASNV